MQLTKPTAGHYIFDAFHKEIETLKKRHNIRVTVQWVPGHKGVKGNKRADEQAKKAITEGSSDKQQLPRLLRKMLPHSRSTAKWAFRETLKHNTQKLWQKSPRYARMKKTDPTTPSNKYLKLIANLPWKLASILSQLRTGHTLLAKHLHHIGKVDSPICPECQQGEETLQHFMLHCTAHREARRILCNGTGGRNIDITKLLTTPNTLPALFKYVAATRQFHSTFGDLPTLDEERQETGDRRGR
jgi:hypothetical protein